MTRALFISARFAARCASAPSESRARFREGRREARRSTSRSCAPARAACIWLEPLVEVETAGRPHRLRPGQAERRRRPVRCRPARRAARTRLRLGRAEDIPWLKRQTRLTFERCGIVDPLLARRLRGAWRLSAASTQGARSSAPTAIVEEVVHSGLRGRGGAGFPTGIKWRTVADDAGRSRNTSSAMPTRAIQRHLRRPHDHGRRSLRADRGHDHRRHRGRRHQRLHLHPLRVSARASRRWRPPSRRARAGGLLGAHRAARRTASTSRCASAPAPMSAAKKPRCSRASRASAAWCAPSRRCPRIDGLFGKPTVINNVLSLATVPIILDRGRRATIATSAWAARAARMPIQLAGNIKHGGLVETAFGITLRRAGLRLSAAARAPAARCARCRSAARSAPISRESLFDTPFDYEAFAARDGLVGHGGIVVFDDTRRHGRAGALRDGVLRDRVLRQVHALPHRLGARRRGDRQDHRRRRTARRNLDRARRSLRHDAFGSLCALGGFTPYPGAERARPFPRGFRRSAPAAPASCRMSERPDVDDR